MSYRVLVLPEIDPHDAARVAQDHELVAGGATVVGPKPVKSPSLAGYPSVDGEVQALAGDLWGDSTASASAARVWEGQGMWGVPLADVLASMQVPRDFDYSRALGAICRWIHRRSGRYLHLLCGQPTDGARTWKLASCRAEQAELWHPDSGAIEPAGYAIATAHYRAAALAERESVFVVFRRARRCLCARCRCNHHGLMT